MSDRRPRMPLAVYILGLSRVVTGVTEVIEEPAAEPENQVRPGR